MRLGIGRPVGWLFVVIAVGACGTSTTSPTIPSGPQTSDPSATSTAGPVETLPAATPGPLLEGQTETDFGRIWDTLPGGFPQYPGATLSDEAAEGASSGVYVVDGDPEAIAVWFQDQLEIAAFSTESLSGPFEDGGFEIDSVGQDPICRLRITITPRGGLTALTTFYGASCPHG